MNGAPADLPMPESLSPEMEEALLRFEEALRSGTKPELSAYMPAGSVPQDLLVELVHVELEHRLKQGEEVDVGEYPRRFPALADDPSVMVDLLEVEYRLLQRRGWPATLEDRVARYPELGPLIRARFGREPTVTAPPAAVGAVAKPQSVMAREDHRWPLLPGYEVLEELGRGGMGVVYLARELALNRLVALKMIRAGRGASAQDRSRFRKEAEMVARLRHPNIVQIHAIEEVDGMPCLALEYLDGGSLSEYLAGSPQPPQQAALVVEVLARAVQAAHEEGVLHRDLKPANILLEKADLADRVSGSRTQPLHSGGSRNDTNRSNSAANTTRDFAEIGVKITDFGLARRLEEEGETETGALLGTPGYMAPEQIDRQRALIGPGVDVYGLGAILYEMLTGRPPFKGVTLVETLEQVRHSEPIPPRQFQPGVPRDLEVICLKCLHKLPGRRYQRATHLADDLGRFLRGEPIQARAVGMGERLVRWCRRRPLVACLLVAVCLSLGVGTAVATWFAVQARQEAAEAVRQRDEADRARRRTDLALYASRVTLAYREWQANNVLRAEQVLDRECPPHLRSLEWDYLKRLCHPELLTLQEEAKGGVNDVVWTPDGQSVIGVCAPRSACLALWDPRTGQQLGRLGEGLYFYSVAVSRDGKRLAASCGGKIRPNRKGLMVQSGDVKVWDLATRRLLCSIENAEYLVRSVSLSPDGCLVAAGTENGLVKIWLVDVPLLPRVLGAHKGEVGSVVFSPDGKRLASARATQSYGQFERGEVTVWDIAGGKKLALDVPRAIMSNVAFSPDGRSVACGVREGTVRLWDASTGLEQHTFTGMADNVRSVSFSPDGTRLAGGSTQGEVTVWDVKSNEVLWTYRGHREWIRTVAFSPDGKRLAAAIPSRGVRVWDTAGGSESRVLRIPAAADRPGMSADGRRLLIRDGDRLSVYSLPHGRLLLRMSVPALRAFALSPDGERLAAATTSAVLLLETDTGKELLAFGPASPGVRFLAYSGDGRRLVTLSETGVQVWNGRSGKLERSFEHPPGATNFVLSADGRWLALAHPAAGHGFGPAGAARPAELVVKELTMGRDRVVLRPFPDAQAIAFSEDGRLLACTGPEKTILLWDTATGELKQVLRGSTDVPNFLAFTQDGRGLLSCDSFPGTVRFWDVETGQELLPLSTRPGSTRMIGFSAARKLLVSSEGGLIHLRDLSPVDAPR